MKFKRIVLWMLVAVLTIPTISIPKVALADGAEGVTITVTDSTGATKIENTAGYQNNPSNGAPTILKGSANVNISYSGTTASNLSYQIVTNPVNTLAELNALPANSWISIPLNGSDNINDVVTNKPGYFNRKSYDVTMLPNISDTATWENRTKVFQYPFQATEQVSTATSLSESAYGKYIDYLDHDGVKGRRYETQTMFGVASALNASHNSHDLYPSDDIVVEYNGKEYCVINNTVTIGSTTYNLRGNNSKYISVNGYRYYTYATGAKYQESSKFWGYFKAPASGNYYLGIISDDGSTGSITVNGTVKKFTNQFKVQGSTWNTDNSRVYLTEGTYYPMFIEYFNWGGGARFQLYYSLDAPFSSIVSSTNCLKDAVPGNAIPVPGSSMYPSKNLSTGEFANTTFAGSLGNAFPTTTGNYYVIYKSTKYDGTIVQSGCSGPYVVTGKADIAIGKRPVQTNGNTMTNFSSGDQFDIEYSISPQQITPTAKFGSVSKISLKNLMIEDTLSSNFTIMKTDGNGFLGTTGTPKFSYVLPDIVYNYNSTTKMYVPEQSVYKYTVRVKLNTAGSGISISVPDASRITYTDPCDDAVVTKKFDNTTLTAILGAPSITADVTEATSGNVTLTATYSADTTKKLYSIVSAEGPWLEYSDVNKVVATANGTFYFKGQDAAGNSSNVVAYEVRNIDKTAPTPTFTSNPANDVKTNGNVVVRVKFTEDSVVKQYKVGAEGTWTDVTGFYTDITVTNNNTVIYARAKDGVGNLAGYDPTVSYTVTNIDKVIPAAPTLTRTPDDLVKGSVTVNITYPSTAVTKYFKVVADGVDPATVTWTSYSEAVYSKAVGVSVNYTTVMAMYTNSLGTNSTVGSILVDNIIENLMENQALKFKNGKSETSITKKGRLDLQMLFTTNKKGTPVINLVIENDASGNESSLSKNATLKATVVTDDKGVVYDIKKVGNVITLTGRTAINAVTTTRLIKLSIYVNGTAYSTKASPYTMTLDGGTETIRIRVVRNPKLY